MKYEFDKNNLESLARLLGVDSIILQLLYDSHVLDTRRCLAILVKSEYVRYLSVSTKRKGDLLHLLAKKHAISVSATENIIYNKNTNKPLLCSTCKCNISKYKFKKNDGNCDCCTSKMKTDLIIK